MYCDKRLTILNSTFPQGNGSVQPSLSILEGGVWEGWEWVPGPPSDTKICDAQVPYVKWHGICIQPRHLLLYT